MFACRFRICPSVSICLYLSSEPNTNQALVSLYLDGKDLKYMFNFLEPQAKSDVNFYARKVFTKDLKCTTIVSSLK